ncbi:MAG TPA: type IV toxin-antitoxin system AbiEi family antitoxin domain-containing protein [Trebonia sp.]
MPYMPPGDERSDQGHWELILHAQERIVSATQARAVGMSADAIRSKVDSGRWQRVYHGVYATFTGELPRQAHLWAAVLRCGRSAVLSHETAAEVHGLTRGPADAIHVTVPLSSNPARLADLAGVVVHRSANWKADTQPPWTLPRTPVNVTVLDLVDCADNVDDAYAWLSRAITERNTTADALRDALAERKKISKRSWLADALTDVSDGVYFPLELRWTRDVQRAHGLPVPTRQVRRQGADGIRFLDNYYAPYGLAVELDGLAFHPAENRDRERYRDNEAIIAVNAKTLRYGFRQVANHPCDQAAQFARALVKNGWDARTLKPCQRPRCPVART